MQFGPFSQREIREIGAVLNERGVAFGLEEDRQALEAERQRMASSVRMHPTASEEIRHVWIEIADEDLGGLGDSLRNFSISDDVLRPQEPMQMEDYICPTCRHSAPEPGVCPAHSVPLLEYSVYMAHKRAKESEAVRKNIWIVLPVFLAIGLLAYAMYSYSIK